MSDRAGRGPLRAARFARGTGVLRAHPPFAGHVSRPPGSDGRDTGAANGGHDPIADLRHHARTAGGTGRRAHPRFRFAASVPRWRALCAALPASPAEPEYFVPTHRLPGIGAGRQVLTDETLARRTEAMIQSQTFGIMREPLAAQGAERIHGSGLQRLFR